jgi:hypothetical protein
MGSDLRVFAPLLSWKLLLARSTPSHSIERISNSAKKSRPCYQQHCSR